VLFQSELTECYDPKKVVPLIELHAAGSKFMHKVDMDRYRLAQASCKPEVVRDSGQHGDVMMFFFSTRVSPGRCGSENEQKEIPNGRIPWTEEPARVFREAACS
jgi:hypothetical protein